MLAVADDPDGDTLTYAWSAGGGFTIEAGEAPAEATLTAPDAREVAGIIAVRVDDGKGGVATGTLGVRTQGNARPVLVSLTARPPRAPPGGAIELLATAYDPDGDPLLYAWLAPESWALTTRGEAATVVAPVAYDTVALVSVTLDDGKGGAVTGEVVVATRANRPPVITSTPGDAPNAGRVTWTYQVVASDPDGDPLTYALGPAAPAGTEIDALGGLLSWRPLRAEAGAYAFDVLVSDGGDVARQRLQGEVGPYTFRETPIQRGLLGTNMAVADLDGDGRPDVVSVHSDATLEVVLTAGDGLLPGVRFETSIEPTPMDCASLATGDVDGDGDIDVVFSCRRYLEAGVQYLNPNYVLLEERRHRRLHAGRLGERSRLHGLVHDLRLRAVRPRLRRQPGSRHGRRAPVHDPLAERRQQALRARCAPRQR